MDTVGESEVKMASSQFFKESHSDYRFLDTRNCREYPAVVAKIVSALLLNLAYLAHISRSRVRTQLSALYVIFEFIRFSNAESGMVTT